MALASPPSSDDTYFLSEKILVAVTFTEAMDVDMTGGRPRLKIKMDPDWGEFWANYEGGAGTSSLTFVHTVVEPNTSSQGIAVLAQTLDLNGGAIRTTVAQTDAHLLHAGLGHGPDHKVDWRR